LDDDVPPHAFVQVRGQAEIGDDPEQLLRFATESGARCMGIDRADEFGARNPVPDELLIHITPKRCDCQRRRCRVMNDVALRPSADEKYAAAVRDTWS
jgi:hypothetical protein